MTTIYRREPTGKSHLNLAKLKGIISDFPGIVKVWYSLFLVSSLSLFLELAVIRWISGEVRLFSYFKNLPLLAAFLGLSVGFFMVRKSQNYLNTFAPLFGIFVILVVGFNIGTAQKPIIYPGVEDIHFWGTGDIAYWLSLVLFLGIVIIFFMFILLLFIPLGQAIGKEMAVHHPIPAYIVNLLASLFGIWMFSFLSYLQTPPLIWIGLAVIGFSFYLSSKKLLTVHALLIFIIIGIILAFSGNKTIWSPYNRLNLSEVFFVRKGDGQEILYGYNLDVQQTFYQYAFNLSDDFVEQADIDGFTDIAAQYNLPYTLLAPGSKVLIVGAGMGNDVAAAIRGEIAHVDAVEIDPAIAKLGRQYHPEKPYDDPRVDLIVDDARSYFNNNQEKYDAIIFGLLDSHTLLSSMSSVRLDSFVYTIESFKQVQKHLENGGIAVLTFQADNNWMEERLGRMLGEVFGYDKIYISGNKAWGTTFVASSLPTQQLSEANLYSWIPDPSQNKLPLTTDDWPYLYMRDRKIPAGYLQALALICIVCFVLMKRTFPDALQPNWHFFLLGAAFLLVEFKTITELALLFGTTWFVNSLAITGVLVMSLVANIFVLLWKRKVNIRHVYSLLFISLFVTFIFPLQTLASLSPITRAVVGTTLLSLPLLFSGLIFAISLKKAGETTRPFASNFSGSVVGGMLEYSSLIWGIKSLYILGFFLYLGSMFSHCIGREK
jgi:spermidine synthase